MNAINRLAVVLAIAGSGVGIAHAAGNARIVELPRVTIVAKRIDLAAGSRAAVTVVQLPRVVVTVPRQNAGPTLLADRTARARGV